MEEQACDNHMDIQELEIPVPWGHIAAKAWGKVGGTPVLGLHGFLDNANTFDGLVPFLPADVYFVAIDLPGHGCSSHRPPGVLLYFTDYVVDVKRVVEELGWTKFTLIGHSLGAQICFLFAAMFPECVDKMVLLDNLMPFVFPGAMFGKRLSKSLHSFMHAENYYNSKDIKLYTKEEIIQRFLDGHKWCTEASAEILARRGCRVVSTYEGVRYAFTRDPRLKARSPPMFGNEELVSCCSMVSCEVLYIRANQGIEHDGTAPEGVLAEYIDENLERMKASCKKLDVVHVDGNHHVHLNNPERVGPHVARFLQTSPSSKL